MNIFGINAITILLILIFTVPILAAVIQPFSRERMHYSLISVLNSLEFLIGVVLAVFLARLVFSDKGAAFLSWLYKVLPFTEGVLAKKDILAYMVTILVLFLLISYTLRLLLNPLYKYFIIPLSVKFSSAVSSLGSGARRIVNGLWQLPRSLWLVLIASFILNLCTSFNTTAGLSNYINSSGAYQFVYENALHPLLNTSLAKQVPVLFNDSFKQSISGILNESQPAPITNAEDQAGGSRKFQVTQYFNGMPLDDAIKSDASIDNTAREVVGNESDVRRKGLLLYQWVCSNIKYDDNKARVIAVNSSATASGAIVAYNTRKGVCFDYACLYIAMCRAVDVKVRFITGLGYSGVTWGDHAWNQIYYPGENRWINVDTTFGSSGINYFDRSGFSADHKYAEIQGEW